MIGYAKAHVLQWAGAAPIGIKHAPGAPVDAQINQASGTAHGAVVPLRWQIVNVSR